MSLEELNALSNEEKLDVYKSHEMNIRQCLGEAVPTEIMRQLAAAIRNKLAQKGVSLSKSTGSLRIITWTTGKICVLF